MSFQIGPPPAEGEPVLRAWFSKLYKWLYRFIEQSPTITTSKTLGEFFYYPVDCTAGNVTVTIPLAAENKGKRYFIKKIDTSAYTVTIARSGSDVFDGATSLTLYNSMDYWVIFSGGKTNWTPIGSGNGLALVAPTNPLIIDDIAGVDRSLFYETNGSLRWGIVVNDTAEGGSSAGSDLEFRTYDDTGSSLDTPFSIDRSSNVAKFMGYVGVNGATPSVPLQITGDSNGSVVEQSSVHMDHSLIVANNTTTNRADILFKKATGSIGSLGASANGDYLGFIRWCPYNTGAGGWAYGADVFSQSETPSGNYGKANLQFGTNDGVQIGPIVRQKITSAGNVLIGALSDTGARVSISGSANETATTISSSANMAASLALIDTASGAVGQGGKVLFGADGVMFAGIRGYLTNGGNNGIGYIFLGTRHAGTDSTITADTIIYNSGLVVDATAAAVYTYAAVGRYTIGSYNNLASYDLAFVYDNSGNYRNGFSNQLHSGGAALNWLGIRVCDSTTTGSNLVVQFRGDKQTEFKGGVSYSLITNTASTYTVLDTDHTIMVSYAGTCTVTLPTPANFVGRELWFKTVQAQSIVSASSNVYLLNGSGTTTTICAAVAGRWSRLQSDGTYWHIMANG